MVVDHIAYFMIPPSETYVIMRIIGRLAAPIFWFCFVEGYIRTRSRFKYKIRLLISAIVMGCGNLFLHGTLNATLSIFAPNMFLSFFISALIIDCIEMVKGEKLISKKIIFLFGTVLCIAFGVIHCEYSSFIVVFILIYRFVKNNNLQHILFACSTILLSVVLSSPLQIFSIVSIIFFCGYNNEKPKYNMKYFFYLFYPIHIWILAILSHFISK